MGSQAIHLPPTLIIDSQAPAAAATVRSAVIDLFSALSLNNDGDLIVDTIDILVQVAGFAAAPTGTVDVTFEPWPYIATVATAFEENETADQFTVAADQAYNWRVRATDPVPVFKVAVLNNTNQNMDAAALDVWCWAHLIYG